MLKTRRFPDEVGKKHVSFKEQCVQEYDLSRKW